MAKVVDCPGTGERDVAVLYLAGKLPEDEAEAFEAHYFECERCWEEVQRGSELRAALGKPAVARSPAREPVCLGLAPACRGRGGRLRRTRRLAAHAADCRGAHKAGTARRQRRGPCAQDRDRARGGLQPILAVPPRCRDVRDGGLCLRRRERVEERDQGTSIEHRLRPPAGSQDPYILPDQGRGARLDRSSRCNERTDSAAAATVGDRHRCREGWMRRHVPHRGWN